MKKRLLSAFLAFFCMLQLFCLPAFAQTAPDTASVITVSAPQEDFSDTQASAVEKPAAEAQTALSAAAEISVVAEEGADGILASGFCGRDDENMSYTVYADGRLVISGSGAMMGLSLWTSPPWNSYRSQITSVVVEEGVTSVSATAFAEMPNLVSAKLPSTMDTILSQTFYYCRSLRSVEISHGMWNIASSAFEGCSSLVSMDLPDSVEIIQDYAFQDCTSLSSVKWSSSLREIGMSAFRNCDALTAVSFPNSLEEISSSAFWQCDSLSSVSFSQAAVSIGRGAFEDCPALTSAAFSKNASVEGNPFANCANLKQITVPADSPYLCVENNVLFSADKETLICYPNGLGGAYTVPSYVKAIAKGAFAGCAKLTSVTVGEQVDYIGQSAFADCTALVSVTLPAAIDPDQFDGGSYLFENCTSLVSVRLPDGMERVGSDCFRGCKALTDVSLPDSVRYLNSSCFTDCVSLKSINLPKNLLGINGRSFENCTSLPSIEIPDGVTYIDMHCFDGCTALESIKLPANLTSIAMAAFQNCTALKEIDIPDNVTYIGQQCFADTTSLTEVRLPGGLNYVYHSMFRGSGVKKVTVPASVTEIDSMFVGGNSESSEVVVVFEGAPPVLHSNAFQNAVVRAYYPAGMGWSDTQFKNSYAGIVTWICGDGSAEDVSNDCGENASWAVANGVLTITGSGPMFDFEANNMPWYSQNSVITSVVIGEGITSIGANAFCNMGNITSVTVPSTLTRVGERAFYYCGKLESISLPDSVSEIGKETFYSCDRLTAPLFPAGMKTLAEGVYGGCAGFTAVAIPVHITDIGESAFAQCSNLETVSIPASVTAIGQMAFNACAKLTAITVEEGNPFYSAADGILYNKEKTALLQYPCGKAEECIVPEGVKTVASYAFRDARVTSIRFTGAAPVIEEYAFYGLRIKVRYPFGTAGWEGAAQGSYGGTIEWIAYDPITGRDLVGTRLADLTQLDYIVLSQMAYRSFRSKELNRPLAELAKEWNSPVWDGYTYTYTELTENLADWYVADIHTSALDFELVDVDFAGYYAVIFKNAFGEVVIAYRGSIPLQLKLATQAEKWGDVIGDWIVSDLMTEILDVFSPQFHMALETYERVLLTEDPTAVATTGHSLGGALANVVSAYSGCKCESVNAISAMDTAYGSQPDLMGKNFDGVDRWNILDHANECDYIAGVFEWFFTTCIKPYAMHESALEDGNTGFKLANHSVSSIMQRDTEGEPQLSRILGYRIPNEMIKSSMLTSAAMLWLGTSAQDSMKAPAVSLRQVMYGGMGADTLIGGRFGDTIVGGKGNDTLDGGYGNDTYYYFAGDGMDTIRDIGGRDELALYGMEWNDVSVEVDADDVYVLYAGETVARISRSVRSAKNASFAVVIHRGTGSGASSETIELDDYFTGSYSSRVEVACPVRILVVSEAKEEVVYIVPDGAEMVDYTEYGNFYVYEESEGDYGKILDLADGYYICIMGTGEGEMTVEHWDTGEEGLVSNGKVEAVQVTPKFGAAVVRDKDDAVILRVGGEDLPFIKDSSGDIEGGGEVPSIPTGEISKKTWSVSVESVIYLNYYMNIEGFEGVDLAKAGGVVVWTGE
ncbi:MAG: leucine-rich repeat protein, partial [Oscillospiraceae bacterium]|nr:leucine-rich repeat protein [Oscillospiraceae bacterium]